MIGFSQERWQHVVSQECFSILGFFAAIFFSRGGSWTTGDYVFKTVRALITEHALAYARGTMPGGFANIAGITASPQNSEYLTRT